MARERDDGLAWNGTYLDADACFDGRVVGGKHRVLSYGHLTKANRAHLTYFGRRVFETGQVSRQIPFFNSSRVPLFLSVAVRSISRERSRYDRLLSVVFSSCECHSHLSPITMFFRLRSIQIGNRNTPPMMCSLHIFCHQ